MGFFYHLVCFCTVDYLETFISTAGGKGGWKQDIYKSYMSVSVSVSVTVSVTVSHCILILEYGNNNKI